MFAPNFSSFIVLTSILAFGMDGWSQSRYCMALAEEAAELEEEWLTLNSRRLGRDQAILASEYIFAPYLQIDAVATPPIEELCRRANSDVSKKAASLCYCNGSQAYAYQPLYADNSCEVYQDSEGQTRAYVAALVQCY